MPDETADQTTTPPAATPAKKAPPTPVNLPDFLSGDLAPLLTKELTAAGVSDLQLEVGAAQLTARWDNDDCRFTIYFDEGTLEGRKTLAYQRDNKGEILQMFMPPERGFNKPDSVSMVGLLVLKFSSTLSWIGAKVG